MNVNNTLFNEYKKLPKKFIADAIEKENKQLHYLKNFSAVNNYTGEIYSIYFSYEKQIKQQYENILQKIMYNKVKASENNLIPIFITFTAPSRFHPFKQKPNGKNVINEYNYFVNNYYEYNSIDEGIKEAYQFLNKMWREYYINIKTSKKYRKIAKKIRYDLFFEYHKSYIPHLHALIYIPTEMYEYAQKSFVNLINKNNMEIRANKFLKIEDKKEKKKKKLNKLDGAVLYISKYIRKTLDEIVKKPENVYQYIGWKSAHKIRIYRGSNSELALYLYNKIYHNLEEKEKKTLLERAKKNNTCLLYEIEKIAEIKRTVINTKKTKIKNQKINKKYYANVEVSKQKRYDKMAMIDYLSQYYEPKTLRKLGVADLYNLFSKSFGFDFTLYKNSIKTKKEEIKKIKKEIENKIKNVELMELKNIEKFIEITKEAKKAQEEIKKYKNDEYALMSIVIMKEDNETVEDFIKNLNEKIEKEEKELKKLKKEYEEMKEKSTEYKKTLMKLLRNNNFEELREKLYENNDDKTANYVSEIIYKMREITKLGAKLKELQEIKKEAIKNYYKIEKMEIYRLDPMKQAYTQIYNKSDIALIFSN
ncbi:MULTISPECIES: replication endonuclease [unclassified Nitratiruptor]|uniref:replication endonuclease n=1 Tax=unclassified Nitratiruptor TaxID=2624044 RepID=UPI0019162041|nr:MULTISPECIES: replication endonuclease [unclassified Nitratiruptor]BCD59711.1 DNA double-strand break repair Rad50 ATPase [Nitratiruptor sp. YY08-10]BCD63635.1 DNA double-strand break repair Rad50 ATPase [Nitratiruptor sp. YY08-14]